jgi:hypothetical protein
LFAGVQVVIAKTDYYYYDLQRALCIASTLCKEHNFISRFSLKKIMAFKGSGRIGAN